MQSREAGEVGAQTMALPEWFHELAGRVRNWGRWGVLDEIGTVNLIDGGARRRGAASVRSGRAFSLAMSLQQDLLNTADEGPTTRLHMKIGRAHV